MGCDIHLHTERRTSQGWERAEALIENPWAKYSTPEEPEPNQVFESWYSGRNYTLFGILAGVRDDSVPSIEDPRGLPADASASTREEAEGWGIDGHSHSYFTFRELLAFEWDTPWQHWDGYDATLQHAAGTPFLSLLLRLQEVADTSSPEDVRIVFWFDN